MPIATAGKTFANVGIMPLNKLRTPSLLMICRIAVKGESLKTFTLAVGRVVRREGGGLKVDMVGWQ